MRAPLIYASGSAGVALARDVSWVLEELKNWGVQEHCRRPSTSDACFRCAMGGGQDRVREVIWGIEESRSPGARPQNPNLDPGRRPKSGPRSRRRKRIPVKDLACCLLFVSCMIAYWWRNIAVEVKIRTSQPSCVVFCSSRVIVECVYVSFCARLVGPLHGYSSPGAPRLRVACLNGGVAC